ncbi:hypothetical protein PBY51_013719 [Eleginops maclovinus]|uniref:EF-hand domain-containing protein n=1 Tax=Eleginops maclovinus TaxID=56733 RepID=A0AAN7Y6K2_ELEMC|nr:hypothetical protein PBY51_013719 [Eleginops maclovinus]
MERTRAARKSEWLRSALAHHHCPDPGVENEIVVLANGIDQYLQEVFHHLAYPNREDTVSAEDFSALCAVLGIPERGQSVEKNTRNMKSLQMFVLGFPASCALKTSTHGSVDISECAVQGEGTARGGCR